MRGINHIAYGSLRVAISNSAAVFSDNSAVLAIARRCGRLWVLGVRGHVWPVTPDMPTARFNQIPGGKITHTPRKGFKSWQACADEVERIIAATTERTWEVRDMRADGTCGPPRQITLAAYQAEIEAAVARAVAIYRANVKEWAAAHRGPNP
jgi:hypothetical protein